MNILISQRLKELMKESGLNQVQLAKVTGLKQNSVSRWLAGKKEPCIANLWILADFFNCDIDYLVGRKAY